MTTSLPTQPHIVMKVSLSDTFRGIAPGTSVTYDCRDTGYYNCAVTTTNRLNAAAGRKEYTIVSTDNGATYTVTRAEAPEEDNNQ